MTKVLGIDPGYSVSAWLCLDRGLPTSFGIEKNEIVLKQLENVGPGQIAIETVSMGGMIAGKETFDTCIWIGQYLHAATKSGATVHLMKRMDIKMHLCNTTRAKDCNIRASLIDKHGGIASTKKGGPLYKISKDVWSALAIATVFAETHQLRPATQTALPF